MRCRFLAVVWLGLIAGMAAGWAEERSWTLRATFLSLKADNASVAVEVPLATLSEADRAAIREAVEPKAPAEGKGTVTARGPLGKSVALAVPELLKAVETDAIWCRDAADAELVYRLHLAGDSLSAAERSAADSESPARCRR